MAFRPGSSSVSRVFKDLQLLYQPTRSPGADRGARRDDEDSNFGGLPERRRKKLARRPGLGGRAVSSSHRRRRPTEPSELYVQFAANQGAEPKQAGSQHKQAGWLRSDAYVDGLYQVRAHKVGSLGAFRITPHLG